MPITRALIAFFVLSFAASLRADFSGDFAVGTPANHYFEADPNPDLGNWNASFNNSTGSGGGATINTLGAPGQVDISVSGYPGGTASIIFYYNTFTYVGIVSFDLTGSLAVDLDGTPVTSGDNSYSFWVNPGQTLSFNASATGILPTPIFPPGGGPPIGMTDPQVVTNGGTISNFNVAAIPEPSAFAFAAGVCALGFGVSRRRRA